MKKITLWILAMVLLAEYNSKTNRSTGTGAIVQKTNRLVPNKKLQNVRTIIKGEVDVSLSRNPYKYQL